MHRDTKNRASCAMQALGEGKQKCFSHHEFFLLLSSSQQWGRVPRTVFARHYLVAKLEYKDKVLRALNKLKKEIEKK